MFPPIPPIVSGMAISSSFYYSRALFTIFKNASSTETFSIALVSKYGIFPLAAHQASAYSFDTYLSSSLSHLFPINTNGNFSGSAGPVCSRKPFFQVVALSNVAFRVISNVIAQQSAPL